MIAKGKIGVGQGKPKNPHRRAISPAGQGGTGRCAVATRSPRTPERRACALCNSSISFSCLALAYLRKAAALATHHDPSDKVSARSVRTRAASVWRFFRDEYKTYAGAIDTIFQLYSLASNCALLGKKHRRIPYWTSAPRAKDARF